MREVKKKSVGPIYTVAAVWLVYGLIFPLYKLWHLIFAVLAAVGAWAIAKKIFKDKIIYIEEPEPEPEPVSYGEEIDAIISEGDLAMTEMRRLKGTIRDERIKKKIDELILISEKIIQDALHDPSDVPQIRRFLNYYLPTTIKLLNAYDRMSDQGIDGKNISGTMSRIEEMLDTAVAAYKKQLDSLFANQALDIETDIEVMNALLAREGLAEGGLKPGI